MSEDKRKSARTQGRFSSDREFHSTRREKERPKSQKNASSESSSSNIVKRKGEASGPRKTPEGVDIQYQENSSYQFDLEKKRKPEELRFHGVKELSTTDNGISRLIYEPNFMSPSEAEEFMTILNSLTKWYEKKIVIRGEEYPQPRLVAWYGPLPYTYSGATLEAAEMPPVILAIKEKVENALRKHNIEVNLNSVLLNKYRTEKDSVAWHSDDEITMGICPTIASVSLGEIRKFEMQRKNQGESVDPEIVFVNLTPGSLIVMDGCMQKDWLHRVPKEYHSKGPRINLTFRTVYAIHELPPQVSFRNQASSESKSVVQAKKAPVEHIFDNDNFPPLMAATPTKPKISNMDNRASENVSPNAQEDIDDVTSGIYSLDSDEYQNNLNKTLNSSLADTSPNSYEEINNFNINESHQLPDKLVGNGYSNDASVVPQTCPSGGTTFTPQPVLPGEGAEIVCFPQQCLRDQTFAEMSLAEGRSQLNANAPDFVPQNISQNAAFPVGSIYAGHTLQQLAREFPSLRQEDVNDFRCAIFDKIQLKRNDEFFSRRDWRELDLLRKISDGTQTHKNQVLILERICSMVENVEFMIMRDREARSPHRYQSQRPYGDYRGGRYRNVYKSNSYRQ